MIVELKNILVKKILLKNLNIKKFTYYNPNVVQKTSGYNKKPQEHTIIIRAHYKKVEFD